MTRIRQLIRNIPSGGQIVAGPESGAGRWEVQTMIMTIDLAIVIKIVEPLSIVAETPVVQRVYADVPASVVIQGTGRQLRPTLLIGMLDS
jgi:hypothetical protein